MKEVTVSAFVEGDTPVVLIEAPILRRLQAENKVLRELVRDLDRQSERLTEEWIYFAPFDEERYAGWEKNQDFEALVQAELSGE